MLVFLIVMSACRTPATCEASSLPCSGGRLVESCRDDNGSFFRIDGTNIIYCDSFTDCAAAQRAAESLCEVEEQDDTGSTDASDPETDSASETGTETETEADTSAGPVDDADGDGFTLQEGDCYDQNALAHPGQPSFFTAHRGDGTWDYNCDLVQEKRFQVTSVCNPSGSARCSRSTTWTGVSSHGVHWLGGIPACGQPGSSIIGCEFVVDHCEPVVETVLQACR